MQPRHFLDLDQLDRPTLRALLDAAHAMKQAGTKPPGALRPAHMQGAVLAMIFERASMRTRVSFDLGLRQLGGEPLFLSAAELQLGERETIADTARVLSRYADAILLRSVEHERLLELARHASVPVINGLTNRSHPCQIMADLLTVEEHVGPIEGVRAAWVGDCNNVTASWVHAAVRLGFELTIACPPALGVPTELAAFIHREKGRVAVTEDPKVAVEGADCVVTDTWVSIGDKDVGRKKRLLSRYQVDAELMARAKPTAVFLHCLPAYRGNEVTADVIDGPQAVVFDEAENRLHAQKAVLCWCLETNR